MDYAVIIVEGCMSLSFAGGEKNQYKSSNGRSVINCKRNKKIVKVPEENYSFCMKRELKSEN